MANKQLVGFWLRKYLYVNLNFSDQTERRILSNFKRNPKTEARLKILY